MAQFFSLYGRWYPGQKVTFNKHELSQILSIYGLRVQRGEWRDYALDSTYDTAMFSIFRSSNEKPAFVVAKTVPRNHKKQAKFSVSSENKTLIQSNSLMEALTVFHEKDKEKKK
ncbi:MAG: DUF2794 domain-containing protein [Alphaproteobacteria bacterium]|nr:MAG: DUF2794 domain-containing protein [Alphaproteobacteria bacterium]